MSVRSQVNKMEGLSALRRDLPESSSLPCQNGQGQRSCKMNELPFSEIPAFSSKYAS
jgi:hypothetical protein